MQRPTIREKKGPEAKIQEAIIRFLQDRGWVVMPTHGNMYQQGFPDLYCLHHQYGAKWIEIKNPKAYKFTPAQRKFFPIISQALEMGPDHRTGIWIMTAATEFEYTKLFKPQNWFTYMFKPKG